MDLGSPVFRCDVTAKALPLPHVWEHTVGSGHATLALRSDWQRQLTRAHRDLGFRYVRFHGVLSDDMGTLIGQNDQLVYSFFNLSQVYDFILSIGMRPFVELSFMPSIISSGGDIVFRYKGNVTPPRNFSDWDALMRKLATHLRDRYGSAEISQWLIEVWNEPNLRAFWTGTSADYFRLYELTARAFKAIDPGFKVGGPATAANAWIEEFQDFCSKSQVPLDFLSTHHYPTDAFGQPGDDTVTELAASRRSILREQVAATRQKARGKPVYYTEWCTSSNPFDELHDQPYAAAFIVKSVLEAQPFVDAYSYWTFSDIFEENYFCSEPFHGGFGLQTIHGIPKPAYRAFELLHRLGDESLPVTGQHETVDVWVTQKPGSLVLLLANSALPRHAIKTEKVRVELTGLTPCGPVRVERIDDDHANARRQWTELGSPTDLLPRAVETLEKASQLVSEPLAITFAGGKAIIALDLPPQGTAAVTIERA